MLKALECFRRFSFLANAKEAYTVGNEIVVRRLDKDGEDVFLRYNAEGYLTIDNPHGKKVVVSSKDTTHNQFVEILLKEFNV